jgi:outer membrane protein assembly factor BamD (BamD/ComL family)
LVDEYDAQFPDGMLSQEATVLRVEALVKEGDRSAAVGVGQRFLAAHPTSPHALRVKQLIEGHNP